MASCFVICPRRNFVSQLLADTEGAEQNVSFGMMHTCLIELWALRLPVVAEQKELYVVAHLYHTGS
jgi:hypothetical protein